MSFIVAPRWGGGLICADLTNASAQNQALAGQPGQWLQRLLSDLPGVLGLCLAG
jgi:hypothetical protein